MAESMQETEISEDVAPDLLEVTASNVDGPRPAESFNLTGENTEESVQENIQYSTEEDPFLNRHDEWNSIPWNSVSYHDAGILPSQLL
jgi:hypothetical protein